MTEEEKESEVWVIQNLYYENTYVFGVASSKEKAVELVKNSYDGQDVRWSFSQEGDQLVGHFPHRGYNSTEVFSITKFVMDVI